MDSQWFSFFLSRTQAAPAAGTPPLELLAAALASVAVAPRAALPTARPAPAPSPLCDFDAPNWTFLDGVHLLDEFALDCPTLRYVPKAARSTSADATEELLRATLRAPRGTLQEERAWKFLLLRERLLFWAPLRLGGRRRQGRGADRQDSDRLVRECAARLLNGDWAALLSECRASGEALTASELPR